MKINSLLNLNLFHPFFYRHFFYFLFFFIFFIILGAGCTVKEVTRAFNGEFNKAENNRVISAYCTSCHNHKKFEAEPHVLKVRLKYKTRLFRRTSECRTCHYIEKTWANDHTARKTRSPRINYPR
jgi:hypothetical protein